MSSRRTRSIADYYRAGLRHKFLLLTPALVLAIAVAAALSKLPSLYKSTAIVTSANWKISESDLASRLDELRQQVTSREALAPVVVKYALHGESLETATAKMRRRINLESASAPSSFAVSYRAEDPESARDVTAELASRLAVHSLEASPAPDSSLDRLRKSAAEISSRLRDLEEREPRLSVEADNPPGSSQPVRSERPSTEFVRAQQMTIEGLRDQQYKFQQQLADVERRIAEQRQLVEQQSKGSALRDNPTYAVLITKRTELQGQRDTLINRQELTDKHPRVLAINDQIAAINRQIEELRKQDLALVSQSPEARELASLLSERNRLKIELEVTDRELARRSTNQAASPSPAPQPVRRDISSSSIAREYLGLKRTQKELASELQELEAKSVQAAPTGVLQFQLLQPADLPTSPISPNRPLLISVAVILGLALGAVFVVVSEATRFNSLQDARDVEHYTRLPLLGTIPRMLTAKELRSVRWRANARILFGAAASIAITVALTRFFIAIDIFSLITKN